MINSSLLTILRIMRAEDLRTLKYLLVSPLFKLTNRHQDAVDLFQYLLQYAPAYDDAHALARPAVARLLFGRRSDPDNELRKSMSHLMQLIKKTALIAEVFHPETPLEDSYYTARSELAFMRFMNKRATSKRRPNRQKEKVMIEQAYDGVKKEKTRFFEQLKDQPEGAANIDFLVMGFEADWQLFQYYTTVMDLTGHNKVTLTILDSLDDLYFRMKLHLTTNLRLKLLVKTPYETESEKRAAERHLQRIDFLKTLPDADSSLLKAYLQAFQLLAPYQEKVSEAAFEGLSALIDQKKLALQKDMLMQLKAVQRVYLLFRFTATRDFAYLENRFELLYRHTLEDWLPHEDAVLPVSQFIALISDALHIGPKYDAWVESFLERFSQGRHLSGTDTPREIYKINRAHWLYRRARYREASNELVGYEWYGRVDDVQALLLAIRIDLKTQYELNRLDDDYGVRTLDAAEKRIKRISDLDDTLKSMTLRFLRVARQLYNLKTRQYLASKGLARKVNMQEISRRLPAELDASPIAEKEWLKSKIEQLFNG